MRKRALRLDENAETKEMGNSDDCTEGNSEETERTGTGAIAEAVQGKFGLETQRPDFSNSSDTVIANNVEILRSGDDWPRIFSTSASDDRTIMQEKYSTAAKHGEDVQRGSIDGSCIPQNVALPQSGKAENNTYGTLTVSRVRSGRDSSPRMQDQMLGNSDHESKEGTDSEDEDEDFNPCLVPPSPGGSSGLSSESEDLEDEHEVRGGNNDANQEGSRLIDLQGRSALGCITEGLRTEVEERENVSYGQMYKYADVTCNTQDPRNTKNYFDGNRNFSQDRCGFQMECGERAVSLGSSYEEEGADADYKYSLEQDSRDFDALSNFSNSFRNEDLDMENTFEENAKGEEQPVDAICRRTRAHYSLADMSLDELEAFLQESDEEDYFQNVDDEEEYRKFVAAVQSGFTEGTGVDNPCSVRQGEDEEDEEDDYDFEVELEEALESDYEEKCEEVQKSTRQSVGRKKRNERKRLLGCAKISLRPLLPYGVWTDAANDSNKFFHEWSRNGKPRTYGFTACQRSQLYCLLHEHVQLLVQVFSLTVLDFSRQQIAVDAHKLLLQLTETREQILSWKKPPFPEVCSCPFYAHSSISNIQPSSSGIPHSCMPDLGNAGSDERYCVSNSPRNAKLQLSIRSLLDIPSIAIVKEFLTDVARVAESFKQRRIQSASDCKVLIRTPLFLKPVVQDNKASTEESQRPKKSMAATLVQDTKSNGIALVPQEISMAISRFISLFNPDLFPHKPPPAALAKRLLFSDAEDELLAMGMMTYNTNWEMIQQHFLPSKTTHQIFVRQKNRSTSRAPENSIKAVRRLKSSPLTKEEQARIDEGLKIFKNDWRKVWEQCVPYRDPTTLSRLWRTALGIQKSYSASNESRAKHKFDEHMPRKKNPSVANREGDTGEVNSGDETCGESASLYLHEAFLTDWNPNGSCFSASAVQDSVASLSLPALQMSCGTSSLFGSSCTVSQQAGGHRQENTIKSSIALNRVVLEGRSVPALSTTGIRTRVSKRKRHLWTSQSFQKGVQTVKLAPGLPSVNLPPCVRVIRHAKLNNPVVTGSIGGSNIHKATVVSSSNAPELGPVKSGMQVSQEETAPELTASRFNSLPMTFACSSELAGSSSGESVAKIHPLLMQATVESGMSSRKKDTMRKLTGQTLGQVPQFRPFVNASSSREKSVMSALSTSNQNGTAELHPFLQEDMDFQTVKDTVHQTIRDTVHQIGSMIHYHNNVSLMHPEWPSVLSDSVIRPEPRRAVRISRTMKGRGKVSHIASDVENKRSSTQEREKMNSLLVQFCEEENIVMEEEELSDSDEESVERVQFEYEEMGDSERECSDHEKHGSDKADEGIEFEEEEIGSEDSNT